MNEPPQQQAVPADAPARAKTPAAAPADPAPDAASEQPHEERP